MSQAKQLKAPADVPARFREAIVSAFPDFAGLPMSVAGKGWHCLAIDIDGRLIAKFPEGEEAEKALRREARLLAALRPHVSLPVPHMTLHGRPLFSLHPRLHGMTLDRRHYAGLPIAGRARLAHELARFFAELHEIPVVTMRQAGGEPVEWWDTEPATLAPAWPHLPRDVTASAREAIDAYRNLRFDPAKDVYGFFDAHGWNMAFDHDQGRLNGIFDFADSGIGPRSREFVQVSLIHPELARLAIEAYEDKTGIAIDRRAVFLLAAAQRLSEFAGAVETGESYDLVRGFVLDWFDQREILPTT